MIRPNAMKRTRRLLAAGALLMLAPCWAAAPNAEPAAKEEDGTRWSAETLDLSKEWGIEILGIRLSAGGYILDLRYRVTDAEKAAPIFQRQNKPVLIDQKSGREFHVARSPTVGPMRPSNTPHTSRTYFMLFGNPGTYLRAGSRVSVEVGPFRVKDLTVQ